MSTDVSYPGVKAVATAIGQVLNRAKIPNLLFGWTALAVILVDFGFPDIDFIIPDKEVSHAIKALTKAGYKLCTSPDCSERDEDRGAHLGKALNRFHPVPAAHFHISAAAGPGYVLSLLKKDDIIPHLPNLKLGLPERKEYEHLTLSNDPRLPPRAEGGPSGPWYRLDPVRVLLARTLTEALLLLRCRHIDTRPALDNLWCDMLWEIMKANLLITGFSHEFDHPPKGYLYLFWRNYIIATRIADTTPENSVARKQKSDAEVRQFRAYLIADGKDPSDKYSWLRKKTGNYA
ncbi:uncharacterized protein DSM5745_00101 [Aspergillus mulundensis]|uniref:Nucleotidyltransferase family protein n=1 Tax=Aspergillus mulundensis TaxID=1810919 RepID=A0A3D8T2N9_9EURO|nr:hypothetical protein DSM5745_00101 [Aspergillus mulundensis]RDW92779.1 hypothetical protein DSM5745_00101 [Aspergillus mulundensis]